jgi:hypothetical protein
VPSRRGLVRAAATVAAGLFAVLLLVLPAAPAPAPPSARVLFIGVPDLRWSDVVHMPKLAALARTSAIANLSVRSSGTATRCGDGLLELSAGTRVPSGVVACPPSAAQVESLAKRYRSTTFKPRIGTLGDAVAVGATPLDPAAAVVLTESTGVPAAVQAVSPGPGFWVAIDTELYGADGPQRRSRLGALDATIDRQRQLAGPDAEVVVAGISDNATGPAHLHAVIVSGPGWGGGELRSASTGRTGYVQLVDLTPTLIALTSQTPVPDSVIGRVLEPVPRSHRSIGSLADDDVHARAAADVSGATRNVLALVVAAVVGLLLAGRREAWVFARFVAAAPVLTFLVQVVPWWRWGTAAYAGLVAAGSLIAGGIVMLLARRDRIAALVAVPAFTAVVLIADQLAGAPLDLSAPMGDNPLIAGRFHGMGNMAFALMASAALFCAGVVAARVTGRRARVAVAGAIGAVALVVDAAPPLGDDFGGLLALLPALVLLVALVAGLRVTWRRVVVVAAATLLVAAAVGAIDAARPADRRTHIGRFVADLVHGHLDPVADRKWRAMLRSFGNVALDVLVVVTAAAAVAVRDRVPRELRAALAAVGVVAVLGTLLNDSGVVVATGAVLAVVPSVIGDTRSSGAG